MDAIVTHNEPGHGFAAPVFDAQAVFRHLLDALARPGTVATVDRAGLIAPAGLPKAAAALLLTLADRDTAVYLAGGKAHPAAHWLAFHAGAAAVDDAEAATFAVLDGEASAPRLAAFNPGDERYPDRSATVIVVCVSLDGGPQVRLTGPGIKDAAVIAPTGLRPGFWAEAAANAARFPLGVDLVLVAGDRLIGLPRSTRIEELA
jgi:alpha-D-ribose 1-methylphosphonate 5-triphosphate synthase subunit PhnH